MLVFSLFIGPGNARGPNPESISNNFLNSRYRCEQENDIPESLPSYRSRKILNISLRNFEIPQARDSEIFSLRNLFRQLTRIYSRYYILSILSLQVQTFKYHVNYKLTISTPTTFCVQKFDVIWAILILFSNSGKILAINFVKISCILSTSFRLENLSTFSNVLEERRSTFSIGNLSSLIEFATRRLAVLIYLAGEWIQIEMIGISVCNDVSLGDKNVLITWHADSAEVETRLMR